MGRRRIKICGLTRPGDVAAAVAAGADAVGFVMVPSSPRFVDPQAIGVLMAGLPPFVTPVAVVDLTDPLDQERARALGQVVARGVRCVQFHGHEAAWEVARCKAALGIRVVKAIRLRAPADLALMASYEPFVDAFLFDGGAGEGIRCDWDLAARAVVSASRPVILAGGLTPDNVAEAIDRVQPFAVDVCTGVESRSGLKDPQRLEAFAAAVAVAPAGGLHDRRPRV